MVPRPNMRWIPEICVVETLCLCGLLGSLFKARLQPYGSNYQNSEDFTWFYTGIHNIFGWSSNHQDTQLRPTTTLRTQNGSHKTLIRGTGGGLGIGALGPLPK